MGSAIFANKNESPHINALASNELRFSLYGNGSHSSKGCREGDGDDQEELHLGEWEAQLCQLKNLPALGTGAELSSGIATLY